ncbi:hypothetical protein [Rubritalea tangerina]
MRWDQIGMDCEKLPLNCGVSMVEQGGRFREKGVLLFERWGGLIGN